MNQSIMEPVRGHRLLVALVGVLFATALLSGCVNEKPAAGQPEQVKQTEPPVSEVAAGVGLKTVVGAAFAPSKITVPVDSTVTWTVVSDEPHQVTFFAEGQARPEGSARQWAATVKAGETAAVDGSTFLHTGVLQRDSKASFTFPKAGNFKYYCPIHPDMEGALQVVPAGQPYTTVAQAEAAAKQESDSVLALLEPAGKAATARSGKRILPDGSTLWMVRVGPKVPAPTGYLEIKDYFPKELKIKKGDTVQWIFETSHSVTFLPPGQQLPDPRPPATKPSASYDGKSLYTSAVPPRRPGEGDPIFELKFPNSGNFPYICQLHYQRLGHVGTITVE